MKHLHPVSKFTVCDAAGNMQFIRLHPEFLKESERAKAFRRAFIIKHFNEMAPLLDERQKAVAQEFLEKQLSRKMPPPPKEGKAN